MPTDWNSAVTLFDAALDGAAQPWVIGLALALATLLLEDLAIAAGAAVAAQGSISWEWAMFSVGAGIALGDLGLYCLGVAAQRWPGLRRRLTLGRGARLALQLERKLAGAILLARVIPGLRFFTYTACGFFRLPFLPFCAWVVLAVTAWTVGLMGLGAWLGAPLQAALGIPAPLAVAIPIIVLALGLSLLPRRSTPLTASATCGSGDSGSGTGQKPHQGMPPLDESGPPLSYFEFWPMWAFYPPVLIYALWLMLRYRGVLLPTVANPAFPGGGLVGESKADILRLAIRHTPQWVAPFIEVDRPLEGGDANALHDEVTQAMERLAQAGMALPVVAKPDLGCRGAGVQLVRSVDKLRSYLAAFPRGERLLLQTYVAYEGEAGIFYCRAPGQDKGRIISITLKYFPHVVGDGRRNLRQLILDDPRAGRLPHLYLGRHKARLEEVLRAGEPIRLAFAGSHSRGAIFRNGNALVTPQMEARFDAIAHQIGEFHFGRFDIRFADFTRVQQGEDFTIVEANGAGAESTHIWDRGTSLWRAWADLMRQYRLLFQIGRANRDRGFKPLSWSELRRWHQREKRLTPLYPPTD